jgi:DNA-binding transcriptional MocR family regulator
VGGLDAATLDRNRLAIGACGATSILEGIATALAPGIVIAADPLYYIYADVLERHGFEVLAVPEDADGLSAEVLERKLAGLGTTVDRVACLYVVTVNNPSATILSNPRRRELLAIATRLSRELGRQVPVFYDLAYELLLHDPCAEPFESVLAADSLGIAYEIGTLSKVLAPALRIGYILGPDGPLFTALVQKTSDSGFSAPPFVQEMAGYLIDHCIEDQLCAVNAGYRARALLVREAIESELGDHVEECRGGAAGFYFYLTLKGIETHPDSFFFRYLSRTTGNPEFDGPAGERHPRVLYIPGVYCVHPHGDLAEQGRCQLRLSYGFENPGHLEEGVRWMGQAAGLAGCHTMASLV